MLKVGLPEFIQETADVADGGQFKAVHGVSHGNPLLVGDRLSQTFSQARVTSFEEKVAGQTRQQSAVGGTVVACIQAPYHTHARIVVGQRHFQVVQQIGQTIATHTIACVKVDLHRFFISAQIGHRQLVANLAAFAREIAFASQFVGFASYDQPALVNVHHNPPHAAPCVRLLNEYLLVDLAHLPHIVLAETRQVAVDLRLVWKSQQPQVIGRYLLAAQHLVYRFRVPATHHQTRHHCFGFVQHTVHHAFHPHFHHTSQQAEQPYILRVFQKHHQERRYRLVLLFLAFIRYCSHRMTSCLSLFCCDSNLPHDGHSSSFVRNLGN